jgi:hypothetical protein
MPENKTLYMDYTVLRTSRGLVWDTKHLCSGRTLRNQSTPHSAHEMLLTNVLLIVSSLCGVLDLDFCLDRAKRGRITNK